MKESTLEKKLKIAIESLGGECLKFSTVYRSGFPDRIILMPKGKIYFVELKSPTGKGCLAPLQAWWEKRLHFLGCEYFLIDSLETLSQFQRRLAGEVRPRGI